MSSARAYMDHNARTPMEPGVCDAVAHALGALVGNPSSPHHEGQRARAAVERARTQVAERLQVPAREVVFTSGATEALHLAIHGGLLAGAPKRRTVLCSAADHQAVLAEARRLEAAGVAHCRVLDVDANGCVPLKAWQEALRTGEVAVAAVIMANNETGVVQDVTALLQCAREAGALALVDAAQCVGRMPVDAVALGAHTLAFSGCKMGGPSGTGAMWLASNAPWQTPSAGGGQERGRRPGTENVAGLVGLGEAARTADPAAWEALRTHRNALEEMICLASPTAVVHAAAAPRLPNTSFVSFPGADVETLIILLDQAGVSAATGSACASGAVEPSHVLAAMGVAPALARSALRFSLGPRTRPADIQLTAAALAQALPRARLV